DLALSCLLEARGLVGAEATEADAIAGYELAHLPPLRAHDRRWAHEAAQARPVGAEHDGHVSRVIDGPNGICGVMNVRGVEPRLATVAASPGGFGPDEANSGPVRVVVHLPRGLEDRLDIGFREEVGRAVWPIEYADLPCLWIRRDERRRDFRRRGVAARR